MGKTAKQKTVIPPKYETQKSLSVAFARQEFVLGVKIGI